MEFDWITEALPEMHHARGRKGIPKNLFGNLSLPKMVSYRMSAGFRLELTYTMIPTGVIAAHTCCHGTVY